MNELLNLLPMFAAPLAYAICRWLSPRQGWLDVAYWPHYTAAQKQEAIARIQQLALAQRETASDMVPTFIDPRNVKAV